MEKFEKSPSGENNEELKIETHSFPILNIPLQKRYDRIAGSWNGPLYEGIRKDEFIPKLIDSGRMSDGLRVLEAMSGTALLSSQIKDKFPQTDAWALDFSPGMLNMIEPAIQKVESSIISTPFLKRSFDRVFLRSALYDLPRQAQLKALQEIRRVLKKDGLFILQTYYSTDDTNKVLNDLVNLKDLASGQYQDMGNERPRYFATQTELEQWFLQAGFNFEKVESFNGIIQYTRTSEMSDMGKAMWIKYVKDLPNDVREKINLREDNGTITFDWPGLIYRLGGWAQWLDFDESQAVDQIKK
ncbi:MAG: methyltransferase domain-containing protein [Patescibacteria group bacterium]